MSLTEYMRGILSIFLLDINRVYRFLTIEGKEIPGCGDKDTISYRYFLTRNFKG